MDQGPSSATSRDIPSQLCNRLCNFAAVLKRSLQHCSCFVTFSATLQLYCNVCYGMSTDATIARGAVLVTSDSLQLTIEISKSYLASLLNPCVCIVSTSTSSSSSPESLNSKSSLSKTSTTYAISPNCDPTSAHTSKHTHAPEPLLLQTCVFTLMLGLDPLHTNTHANARTRWKSC